MDAPSPPGSPLRGKPTAEQSEGTPVLYEDRRFFLSKEAKIKLAASNTIEENHERIDVWTKQIGEGRFTLHGFLAAQRLRKRGILTDQDKQRLEVVLLDGGTQIARLLAEEGHWLAVQRTALDHVGHGLLMRLIVAEDILEQFVRVPGAAFSVVFRGKDDARALLLLARRTQGVVTAVSYVRKDLHPLRDLQDPPRLLRWKYDPDEETGDPSISFDDAISIALNGYLMYAWAGFYPYVKDMTGLSKLVEMYGKGFHREALETTKSMSRVNRIFIEVWIAKPDPGPGAMDLTSREDDAMLEGAERGPKRRRRMARYSGGVARDAVKDAKLAQDIATRTTRLFWRATVLDELKRDKFAIEEPRYVAVTGGVRRILLEPRNASGWTLSAAEEDYDQGVVLTIDARALVGLGYYDLDDPIIEMKIEDEYEEWQDRRLEYYQNEELLDQSDALVMVEREWQENKNDVEWVASHLNVAYFVFYDDVPYASYLNSIRTITYWDADDRRHDVPYTQANLSDIAEEMGE